MLKVVLFFRQECHLCEQVRSDLLDLQEEICHQVVEVDIESDPDLLHTYREAIPVVEIGPYRLKAPISKTDLRIALQAAQDGRDAAPARSPAAQKTAVSLNRMVHGFSQHWLAIFNLLVFFYIAIPFAAPTMLHFGIVQPAKLVYKAYAPLCHQMAYRSWFLFGEQPAYPRELANTAYPLTYEEVSGNDPKDLHAARNFIGDAYLGYKVALCERDVAIYGGILLAGLIFGLTRKWVRPLPIPIWILLGVFPMALDGGIQLLTYLPIQMQAYESTPIMRTLTGLIFGIMNVWLAYPYVEESMEETRITLAAKLAGVQNEQRDG